MATSKYDEYAAIDQRKANEARAWTPEVAAARAAADVASHREHKDEDARYKLRYDMIIASRNSRGYREALAANAPDVAQAVAVQRTRDHTMTAGAIRREMETREPGEPFAQTIAAWGRRYAPVDLELEVEERNRRREATLAALGQAENSVDVQRSGSELERGEFIVPRRVVQAYSEVDGKFYAKDSNRLMFHDQGDKLATSTTDKAAIADMVAYAKAKQWASLKLTGSQEFRREAWLQAESQGIKTQGYTPREADLAALKTLTQERATNTITPLQERAKVYEAARPEASAPAPRHDLNKNQAALYAAALQARTGQMTELQKQPAYARLSVDELSKVAFWRGVVMEENKDQPEAVQEEKLARFDAEMEDPARVKELPDPALNDVAEKSHAKSQERARETHEQSL